MTGSAVKLFREVRPAWPPSSAWSAFWNPRCAARRWREKWWWAYPVASIPWPAKASWEFRGMWRARCGSDPWLVPDRHPASADGLGGFWPASLRSPKYGTQVNFAFLVHWA